MKLTKIEVELLEKLQDDDHLWRMKRGRNLNKEPYKRDQLLVNHHLECQDPIAMFRPQQIICYAGTFKGHEFVAIGGTDEGFTVDFAIAAVSKKHSVIVKKVKKWLKPDRYLRTILPLELTMEAEMGIEVH